MARAKSFTEVSLPSGSSGGNFVEVQVLLPTPKQTYPNQLGSGMFAFSLIFTAKNLSNCLQFDRL